MAKKTKADKKTKSTVNKVSYHYRPDNMTLQDWQIALRRQAAMKEKFVISERDKKEYPAMNIMWYIEDIRVLGIIVRVWILRQANWVLANIWKESNYGLERKDVKFAVSRHRILPYTCLIRESVKFACESVRTMRRSSANWQVLILLPTE